jgi:hypothetical protein
MEKDTPGQIHGITYKSDGKSTSNSEDISDKTQRARNEDFYYEEKDETDTKQYKTTKEVNRKFYLIGFIMIFVIYALSQAENTTKSYLEMERDIALKEQERLRQERQKTPFDEA